MLEIVKQRHVSQMIIPGRVQIINGQIAPMSLETGCYVVKDLEVAEESDITKAIALFINTPEDQVKQVAQIGTLRETGNRVVKVRYVTDRFGTSIPSMIFAVDSWQQSPNQYELHTILVEFQEAKPAA